MSKDICLKREVFTGETMRLSDIQTLQNESTGKRIFYPLSMDSHQPEIVHELANCLVLTILQRVVALIP